MRFLSFHGGTQHWLPVKLENLVWLLLCVLLGVVGVRYWPPIVTTLSLLLAGAAAWRIIRGRMQVWQAVVLLALTGYVILNYGFENYVVGRVAGVPLLIGEGMMFAGLALALRRCTTQRLRQFFGEPAVQCLLFLGVFSGLHLLVEVPRFGVLAFRDASMFIEAIFVLAGFLWFWESGSIRLLTQWLMVLMIVNMGYSYTYAFGESLRDISPTSGVFQPIPLFGQYQHNAEYLVLGALFSLWLAPHVVKWPRWLLMAWAGAQLAALVLLQTRSCYVGIALIGLILILLKDFARARQLAKLVVVGIAGMAVFVGVASSLGLQLSARVVDINAESLGEHALSVFSVGDPNNRLGRDEDRLDWLAQVWEGTTASPVTFLLGQGFGEPLLKDAENEGMAVREPHNSSVGVFGRLGLIGVSVWLAFIWIMLVRFLRVLRHQFRSETVVSNLTLWLFMLYVQNLIVASVQPSLEFPHTALPFYFFLGLALAITQPEARFVNAGSSSLPQTHA